MTITDTVADMRHVAVDDLTADATNLRSDLGNLDDLIASVRSLGIIEPLVVTPDLTVVAGHRRLAAAYEAGLTSVPCIIRDLDESERAEVMLVENLQRAGLNPIEEARGYERLVELGRSQRDIADRVGCNQSHVSKRLKLRALPDAAQAMVIDGSLQVNDALELAKLIELDAESANEWIAGERWPHIAERIRRVEQERKRVAAVAEGEASGLIDARELSWEKKWGAGLREVDREQATHWDVSHTGTIQWLGIPEPTESKPAKPSAADLEREAKRERHQAEEAKLIEGLRAWVDVADRDELVERASGLLTAAITSQLVDSRWGAEVILGGDVHRLAREGEDDYVSNLAADPIRFAAIEILASLAIFNVTDPPSAEYNSGRVPEFLAACRLLTEIDIDLPADALALFRERGGEAPVLDEEIPDDVVEVEAGVNDEAPEVNAEEERPPQAGDRIEDGGVMGTLVTCSACNGEPSEPTCAMCDGDGLLHQPDEAPEPATPTDTESDAGADTASIDDEPPADVAASQYDENTPPWKAYPFGRTPLLIKTIQDHTDADKLAHAAVYELAHQGRVEVLDAIAERRHQLKKMAEAANQ